MTTSFNFKASLIVATLLALPVAQAATMAKADYTADKTRISAEYKTDKAACDALKDNAKDVCAEEAKGKEKVARAELESAYSGKAKDRTKALETKAKADYAVAKEKCDDQAGNAKDVCVKEAKAVETKALADAKMNKEIKEAKKDDVVAKSDADYKVAIEKCDALAGDPKASCVAAAKSKFGKN
jgi:hypothetical protein